jgi:hypothetical protein
MLNNPSIIADRFQCNKAIMRYLVYKCGLPVLGLTGNSYYFADTIALKDALKKMPLHLRLSHAVKK